MTPTTYIGIDPGFTGGYAAIYPDDTIGAWDMPVHRVGATKEGHNALDLDTLITDFRNLIDVAASLDHRIRFGLEDVHSMPTDAPQNAFQFGTQKGEIRGALVAIGHRPEKVAPNAWTARLGQVGKQWNNSMECRFDFLVKHYPSQSGLFVGPRGGKLAGRIDAALIAHFMKGNASPLGKFSGRKPPRFFGAPTVGGLLT